MTKTISLKAVFKPDNKNKKNKEVCPLLGLLMLKEPSTNLRGQVDVGGKLGIQPTTGRILK